MFDANFEGSFSPQYSSAGHLLIRNYGPLLWTFGMGLRKHTILLHVEGKHFYT
jgi:hypothetical protein